MRASLKEELNDNARDIVINKVLDDMGTVEENFNNLRLSAIEELSKTIALSSIVPLNKEIFESDRNRLTRQNYSFPSIINAGKLRSWHSTPSRIIGDKTYDSYLPLLLPIANNGIGFFMNQKFKKEITSMIELSALKLLGGIPNGLARIAIIDKNGSGQNFPSLLMLHDKFTDGKILTEDHEIENEMLALKNSMNTITSSITSNGFKSIEDYNKNTEEVPQPYKFVFIANFPAGFSKKAAEALVAIMESGSNAGIYTFTTFTTDSKFGVTQQISGIPLSEFLKNITMFEFQAKPHEYTRRGFLKRNVNMFSSPMINDTEVKRFHNSTFKIEFEEPDHLVSLSAIESLNDGIKNLNLRPIINILKTIPTKFWDQDAGKGVCAPFAKSGIENIYLSLGINQDGEEESTHHGIIGGATGSGKTVTLHDMILHICMRYSPKDVNFWLLDYKEGTEFATYKDFPYIQILSMESEVEFGQEVLLKAIRLMEERGKLFKSVGAANLSTYNSKVSEEEKLPRIIIIIDEFQVLFPRKAQVTAITNERIDRILRLGRSFGVNLLLSTQTLKGIDMDPQLLSNMPLRIALKMDDKDSIKLFGDDNAAPRFIKYPGEGIYNKSYGNSTANVNFQAFLALGDAVDNLKEMITGLIDRRYSKEEKNKLYDSRFVYNGDLEGLIERNELIESVNEENFKFYIGEPAGLSKEHSYLKFERDFADNLAIVGMDIKKASSIFFYMINQLLTSKKPIDIYFGNFNSSYKNIFNKINSYGDNTFTLFDNINSDIIIHNLYETFKIRKAMSQDNILKEKEIFIMNFFIESSKVFTSSSHSRDSDLHKLREILHEGSELGIHIVMYATSFNTIMNADLSRDMEKFKKKILLRGGNSLKVLGDEGSDTEFSNSLHVAIAVSGKIGEKPFKFKPYINHNLEVEEDV